MAMTQRPNARKTLKTYHATMVVTRMEEWCVDAGSPEEARARLAAGEGHRCHIGDAVQIELDRLIDTQ